NISISTCEKPRFGRTVLGANHTGPRKELPMTTTLRQRMTDDMRLRNRSPKTIEIYLLYVRLFAEHFHTPPDRLSADHARAFLLHLLSERHLAPPPSTSLARPLSSSSASRSAARTSPSLSRWPGAA